MQDAERLYFRQLEFNRLISGGTVTPHWLKDGSTFWYAAGAPQNTVIYRVDPEANTRSLLFDISRVREAVERILGHEPPGRGLPFDRFSFDEDARHARFVVEGREFALDLESYELTFPLISPSPQERERSTPRLVRTGHYAGAPDVMEVPSPDGRSLAGVTNHNLSLRSTFDGRIDELTLDGIEECSWDVEHAKWSPDSLRLAAVKVDTRGMPKFPIVHWLKTQEEIEWVAYAKAGGPVPRTELYLVDIYRRLPVHIDTGGEQDDAIRPIGWLPDGSTFLFLRMERGGKPLAVCLADPLTSSCREVLREEIETFVNYAVVDHLCTLLPQRREFIWLSERNGWSHLYLYNLEGQLICRLTTGEFPVQRVVHVDEDGGWVYLMAQAEARIYDTHLYRVRLDGTKFSRISEEEGQHDAVISPSGKYVLDTHSRQDRPPAVDLRTAAGSRLNRLSEADLTALDGLYQQAPEEFVALADDGITELHGLVFLPPNLDKSKRYPVLDSIYGGPQVAVVPRSFTHVWAAKPRALAQAGFVVMMVDGRGTPGRSKAFHDVIHRNWGRYFVADHVAVVKQLAAERPFMDLDRVGIFGGSWGGYNTIRAMLTAPDVYHVGVAANPVADLYDHIAMAIEPFMGLPQDNREAYEYASCLPLAGNLRGKLLLIHATSDVNAPFSSTIQLANSFMRAGKLYNLLVLPEENHHPQGTAQAYYLNAERQYFIEHLRP